MTRARRRIEASRHSGSAALAALTAASIMPASEKTTLFVTCPVAGLYTSPKRLPEATGLPPIQQGTVSSFSSAGLFM